MLPFWVIFPGITADSTVLQTQDYLNLAPPWSQNADYTQHHKQGTLAETAVSERLAAGDRYLKEGDYDAAINSFTEAIALIEDSLENSETPIAEGGTAAKGEALIGLGTAYMYIEAYADAIPAFEAAIAFFSPGIPIGDVDFSTDEYGSVLIDLTYFLGQAHEYSAHFGTALGYYHLVLAAENTNFLGSQERLDIVIRRGIVEGEIGQYAQAEATLQQAYEQVQQLEDIPAEYRDWQAADTLTALGWVYEEQESFEQAIAQYETAIALYQQIGKTQQETLAVSNLGAVYTKQGNYTAAREALNRALSLSNSAEDDYLQAVLLDSFGALYQAEGDDEAAWQTYRQAIGQTTDKVSAINSLLSLGALMEARSQPDLAILFYKQAIFNIETIRTDLQGLSRSVQQRYTLTVEDFYRHLADLLLQQDRTAEALQIIELLKLQEVKAYLRSNQSTATETDSTAATNPLNTPVENVVVQTFNNVPTDTTLEAFINLPEVIKLSANPTTTDSTSQPFIGSDTFQRATIESLQTTLAQQPVPTAALYPLILHDRLELVLITPEGSPTHYVQPVGETALTETVQQMQQQLRAPVIEPTAEAQQLYQWLIAPIEPELNAQGIENIIYLPDGVLRYIPLSALHDSQQWLANKYPSHTATATAIDQLAEPTTALETSRYVLAGAFTDISTEVEVQIGQDRFPYTGLSAAQAEINALAEIMPKTTTLINQDFTPGRTLGAVEGHGIVHLATHAKFFPGQPESSFILFGDGSTVNMRDIGRWSLPNVDLVVFSACETAVSVEGDGKEILGLGFQIQQTGAKAAIASLWAVNDEATAALMTQFYTALNMGKTKAEALQYAQQQLMNTPRYAHPYNWSGFILMGNGM